MLNTGVRPILVCQSCAEKRLITQDDLIEGTAMATMPTLVEKIASPDYKVLTF
jgi:predicted peroxiredoxin